MALFILRSDEGQPSCVRPMTSGGTYLIMATQTVCALKHRFGFQHLGSYLDNRDSAKRFRGKVPKSDCYHIKMSKARSLMRRSTFETLLSEENQKILIEGKQGILKEGKQGILNEGIQGILNKGIQGILNEVKQKVRSEESGGCNYFRIRNCVSRTGKIIFVPEYGMSQSEFCANKWTKKEQCLREFNEVQRLQRPKSDWIPQESTIAGKFPNPLKSEFLRYTSDEFQKWIRFGNQDYYVNELLKKLEELLLSEKKRMKNNKLFLEKKKVV